MQELLHGLRQWTEDKSEGKLGSETAFTNILVAAWNDLSIAYQGRDIPKFRSYQQTWSNRIQTFWRSRLNYYFKVLSETSPDSPEKTLQRLKYGIELEVQPSERIDLSLEDDINNKGQKKLRVKRIAPLETSEDIMEKTYESTTVIFSGRYQADEEGLLPSIEIRSGETDVIGWSGPNSWELFLTNGSIDYFKRESSIEDKSGEFVTRMSKTDVIQVESWKW